MLIGSISIVWPDQYYREPHTWIGFGRVDTSCKDFFAQIACVCCFLSLSQPFLPILVFFFFFFCLLALFIDLYVMTLKHGAIKLTFWEKSTHCFQSKTFKLPFRRLVDYLQWKTLPISKLIWRNNSPKTPSRLHK